MNLHVQTSDRTMEINFVRDFIKIDQTVNSNSMSAVYM